MRRPYEFMKSGCETVSAGADGYEGPGLSEGCVGGSLGFWPASFIVLQSLAEDTWHLSEPPAFNNNTTLPIYSILLSLWGNLVKVCS